MLNKSFCSSPWAIPALFLIGTASYFLLMEHRQHLFKWLPFLILALVCVERFTQSPTKPLAGYRTVVCPMQTSTICCIHHNYVWVLVAVANVAHGCNVSDSSDCVCEISKTGGKNFCYGIRGCLSTLHEYYARVCTKA